MTSEGNFLYKSLYQDNREGDDRFDVRRDDVTIPESLNPGRTALPFEAELMLLKLVALEAREEAAEGREKTDEPDESCESLDSDSSFSEESMLRMWSCIRASTSPGRGNLGDQARISKHEHLR